MGLQVPREVTIDVVPQLTSGGVPASAAGFYSERDARVVILDYPRFSRQRSWFGVPIDRSLYRSLVAHEVAHAVAAHNFTIRRPSIQAKEYIAYVTTFSMMEPQQRNRVLATLPARGFEGEWQMNAFVYLADPERFGVRAFLHFLSVKNGRDYLRRVLAGRVMRE